MLADSPIFSQIPVESRKNLIKDGETMKLKNGDPILTQGKENDAIYIIGSGSVTVSVNGVKVAHLNKGMCIGVAGLADNKDGALAAVSTSATASSDVNLLKVPYKVVQGYISKHPAAMDRLNSLATAEEGSNRCIDSLTQTSAFDDCSPEFFMTLSSHLEKVKAPKGTQIMAMGAQDNEGMFFIDSGTIDISDNKGIIATLRPGTCFGEMMLLAGSTRSATATAGENCELYQLKRPSFCKLCTTEPKAMDAVKRLAKERSQANRGRKSTLKRV